MTGPRIVAGAVVLPGDLSLADLESGVSAIRPLAAELPAALGAPVPLVCRPPQDWPFAVLPRGLGLTLEALQRLEYDPQRRYGLVLGMPNLFSETEYLEHMLPHRNDTAQMDAVMGFSFDFPLNYLAHKAGRIGPRLRTDSACATGNDALIVAAQWLQAGTVDDVLVLAGSAMLNPVGLALFRNLKALNEREDPGSCPFDKRRRGFVMGEGAAALWLSNDQTLPGSTTLSGWGRSMNAASFVDPPDNTDAMSTAITDAMKGRPTPALICAHGTSTPRGDLVEAQLYRSLFPASPPVFALKSLIGHCLGAAALIEVLVCQRALERGLAPPTLNLDHPDPACDLNHVLPGSQEFRGDTALSCAFGFGGMNSVVLLERTA